MFDTSSPESRFLDYAYHLEFHKAGCQVIYIHISNLRSDIRTTENIEQADNLLSDLAKRYPGELFRLRNRDLACVLKSAPADEVDKTLAALCKPFEKDPLVRVAVDNFISQYNLDTDYDDFLTFAKIQKQNIDHYGANASDRPEDIDFDDPAMVKTITGVAPPKALVEQQTIYRIGAGGLLHPVVHEMVYKPNVLINIMLDGVLMESNPQAETHAKVLLDKHLLSAMPHVMDPWPSPWGVQMSLEGIVSAEFLTFQRYWLDHEDVDNGEAPWFFIGLEDIEKDRKAFRYTKHFLAETLFRLALAEVSLPQLIELDEEIASLHAICCAVPVQGNHRDNFDKILPAALHHFGADKLILCGCHDMQTLIDMRTAGAHLVQGKAADSVFSGEAHWAA